MMNFRNFAAVGLVLTAVACGGGGTATQTVKDPSGTKGSTGDAVSKKAAEGFTQAIDAFVVQEKAGTWTEAECAKVAKQFEAASAEQESAGGSQLPEAHYNAGLAYQRCGNDANAKAQFDKAVSIDKAFHRARAQIALYEYKETGKIDQAISALDKIIQDAKFQNVEGLVALAALQMQRGSSTPGTSCNDDLACAKLNLQRALALDDSFMPAFNQLALYYLEQARAGSESSKSSSKASGKSESLVVSGSKKGSVNKQRLDLAALVAGQAQKKNPNYAPIHNTTGLIMVELENYNGAVKAFQRAVALNPKLFEAQMNYGAVNLSFRGFGEAEKAYRAAIAMKPNTYEARIGLALALRGGITDSNFEQNVKEAQMHLDEAKKLAPERPEAFYNEAILAQEFVAKRAPSEDAQIAEFEKAAKQYQSFVAKAEGREGFEQAVKRSKDRVQDIKDMTDFIRESQQMAKEDEQLRKEAEQLKKEEEARQKAAEAEAAQANGGGAAPAAPAEAPAAPPQ